MYCPLVNVKHKHYCITSLRLYAAGFIATNYEFSTSIMNL
jgi:hypothetical protein